MSVNYNVCKICKGNIKIENQIFNLGQCESCQLIFCLTTYTQSQLIQVYKELYGNESSHYKKHAVEQYNELKNNRIKIGNNRSRMIRQFILTDKCESVLEIGSGIGLLGCYLRNKNPTISYTGIEIDNEAFTKSQSFNLNTINGDFIIMEKLDQKFDVIMLWEVIEHLQDLNLFIELAYKSLNFGGKIILSTPNYNKILNYPKRTSKQIYQDEPPIHLNFFTKENIVAVFKLHGFDDCKVQIKKFPYLELLKFRFYSNSIKSIFGKYHGSTIFFVASKYDK